MFDISIFVHLERKGGEKINRPSLALEQKAIVNEKQGEEN